MEKQSASFPDYRIYHGYGQVGAAWSKCSQAGNDYLSVTLEVPMPQLNAPPFKASMYCKLFTQEDGTYRLVLNREKDDD